MKIRLLKISFMAAIISFVALSAEGQETKPEMPSQEMKPEMSSPAEKIESPAMGKAEMPVEVQNLMKFIGRWESEASLTMEGKTYKVMYWVDCKKTADGSGIFADEGFTNPELGTLSGADLAGYDPNDSKVKWFSVDNMGTTHEHIGEWKTPDHLYIEHNGLKNGQKYVEKIDFIFRGNDELDFKLTGTLDGVESEKAEGIFHKKAAVVK
jgi:hypothetical protein